MYYPIFRGRQNELLAIRELLDAGLLSKRIVPIIEPVTYSSTFANFINYISNNKERQFGIVIKPINGDLYNDLIKANRLDDYLKTLSSLSNVLPSYILNDSPLNFDESVLKKYTNKSIFIYNNSETADIEKFTNKIKNFGTKSLFLLRFSRFSIRYNNEKALLSDAFKENIKKDYNIEYPENSESVLNGDIDYYAKDGFNGFSDYSIIGDEFNDSGFLPKAVVIHMTYYVKGKGIVILHFKSDSNFDNKDPAKKFGEALGKLIKWNEERGDKRLNTLAMRRFEELYNNKQYPGLGYIKKLCIMNHLEIVGRVLDNENSH